MTSLCQPPVPPSYFERKILVSLFSRRLSAINKAAAFFPAAFRLSAALEMPDRSTASRDCLLYTSHRWEDVSIIFQGAMNAFNPVKKVGWQIAEACILSLIHI